jgi:hypothetical protein
MTSELQKRDQMVSISSRKTKWIITCAVLALPTAGLIWLVLTWRQPVLGFFIIHHLNKQQERFILYNTDHAVLGGVLRDFAERRKWKREDFSAKDPQIPEGLRVLKPSALWMFEDYAELEFGGPFGDIGFRAFRPGLKGYGTKQLGDVVMAVH